MKSSNAKDVLHLSKASTGSASIPITQVNSSAPSDTTQVQKLKTHGKIHRRRDPPSMFSDPLDGTSSDDMSFDEVDMYGSDPDAETISLGAGSNHNVQCSDEEVVCVQSAQPLYSTLYI
jgi:hypothetical protein